MVRGRILGIQAKEETNNTQQPMRNLPSRGEAREGGGQRTTHANHKTRQTKKGARGARRQQRTEGEHDTPAPEGVRTCLSGVQRGAKDHTMMNTSLREHTAPQQHRKHGVEGKDPHTGPKAFVAMRHNEEGRQCATTLHAQRQDNQAVAGSNDTQREGPVIPGPRRQRGPSDLEGGPRQAGNKLTKTEPQYKAPTPKVALLKAKNRDQ